MFEIQHYLIELIYFDHLQYLIDLLNFKLKDLFIELIIFFSDDLQLIIFFEKTLPFCLSSMLIVGILKLGVSIMPLEEFPITNDAYLRQDK